MSQNGALYLYGQGLRCLWQKRFTDTAGNAERQNVRTIRGISTVFEAFKVLSLTGYSFQFTSYRRFNTAASRTRDALFTSASKTEPIEQILHLLANGLTVLGNAPLVNQCTSLTNRIHALKVRCPFDIREVQGELFRSNIVWMRLSLN